MNQSQVKNRSTGKGKQSTNDPTTIVQPSLDEKLREIRGKKSKSKLPFLYAVAILVMMLFSFGFGYYASSLHSRRTTQASNKLNNTIPASSPVKEESLSVLPSDQLGYFTESEKKKEAERLFNQAATFSGESEEGRQGWLHLLAAYSYDKTNPAIIANLINNYQAVNYDHLAYSTLIESNLPQKTKRTLLSEDVREDLKEKFTELKQELQEKSAKLDPGKGCSSILFSTAIGQWRLNDFFTNPLLNQQIYDHSINAYEELKRKNPKTSPTDLNHQFFRVQMNDLDQSNSYWSPLTNIPGFSDLVLVMRLAAIRFLRDYHGWSEEAAIRKASHSLIVWISVHTETSTHQPHVTEDALIGGVYYVKTPDGSGALDLYDPRGKHPLYGLQEPTSPPEPPFHRIRSVKPRESTLVLFPGWLVHGVRTASEENPPNFHGNYRVSMSLNLKGEWIDTSNAGFGCPTDTL